MKKRLLAVLLPALAIILLFGYSLASRNNTKTGSTPQPTIQTAISVKQSIDYGDGKTKAFSYSFQQTPSAFDPLKMASDNGEINLETQSYDFGVFVKSIDGYFSTKDKAWIYFVNGVSGNVAADKNELKNGDLVEWKYLTPSE